MDNPILNMLTDAATRGVNVTIITSAPSDFVPQFPWAFTEHWSGEWAKINDREFYAYVRDYDGDYSRWWVKHYGVTVGEGECRDYDAALAAAEIVLAEIGAPTGPTTVVPPPAD